MVDTAAGAEAIASLRHVPSFAVLNSLPHSELEKVLARVLEKMAVSVRVKYKCCHDEAFLKSFLGCEMCGAGLGSVHQLGKERDKVDDGVRERPH